MTQWKAVPMVLAVPLLLVVGASVEGEALPPSPDPGASDIILPVLGDCNLYCTACKTEDGYQGEYAFEDDDYNRDGNAHLDCKRGTCSYNHPKCGDSGEPQEPTAAGPFLLPEWWANLANKLHEADPVSLRVFLANNAHRAFFNADRGAIQIEGCGGTLIASFPLRPMQVAGIPTS